MAERFIALAAYVSGYASLARSQEPEPGFEPPDAVPPVAPEQSLGAVDFAHAATVHELTLMRLAAYEAFERGKASLLASLAEHVLGRELELAPAELEALARRVIDASRELEPISIAVSAADAQRVRTPLPTRVDPSLEAGDLIVDVRDGCLESRFTFRLRAALESASPSAA